MNPRLPTGPNSAPTLPLWARPLVSVNPVLPDWVHLVKSRVSKPQFPTRFPGLLSQELGRAIAEPVPRPLAIAPMTAAMAMSPTFFISVFSSRAPDLLSAVLLKPRPHAVCQRSNLAKNRHIKHRPRTH